MRRKMTAWLRGLLPALALVALAACERSSTPASGVVSLAPAMTATVVELGAEDRLVGRRDYNQSPEVDDLPSVGTSIAPDFEAIARLRPALILTDQSGHAHRADLEALAPVLELPWLTVDDVATGVAAIGGRVDAEAAAAALRDSLLETLAGVPGSDAPRVLLALDGPDAAQTWYIRSNSLHGQALAAAGGRNALPDPMDGMAVLSPEELLAADPDVIVVLASRGEPAEVANRAQERFAGLTTLEAVRSGRIGAVSGERLLLPGPDILELVPLLAAEIERLRP